ncbi:YqzL family protein [Sporolactobacillus terrae]
MRNMLDLTWKLFMLTGNIGPYLLLKEIEDKEEEQNQQNSEMIELKEHTGA